MLNSCVMPLGAYQTNCYLLWQEDREDCLVIDPGYEPDKVLDKLDRLGKRLEAILLTHGHFDHVGAVRQLAADTGCKVLLCEKDLAMPQQMTAGPLYYTDTYGEGDSITLAGITLKVLHTPGHTPGSVCLMAEDAIYSGDTLFEGSCGRTDLPCGDTRQLLASLLRLRELPGDYRVYPGHGPSTTLSQERRFNPYLKGIL